MHWVINQKSQNNHLKSNSSFSFSFLLHWCYIPRQMVYKSPEHGMLLKRWGEQSCFSAEFFLNRWTWLTLSNLNVQKWGSFVEWVTKFVRHYQHLLDSVIFLLFKTCCYWTRLTILFICDDRIVFPDKSFKINFQLVLPHFWIAGSIKCNLT